MEKDDGGEKIIVSQPVIEVLEEFEKEEVGLACMVCREGCGLRLRIISFLLSLVVAIHSTCSTWLK